MQVGIPGQIVVGGVDHDHHARTEALHRAHRFGHELGHGLPGGTAQPTDELPIVEEVAAQKLRHGEGPHRMTDLLQDLLAQQGTEDRGPLGSTGRAEPSTGAAERQQVLRAAGIAIDPREAAVKVTAVQEGVDHVVHEPAPEAIAMLEPFFPDALDVLVLALYERKQRRGTWLSWAGTGPGSLLAGRVSSLPGKGRQTVVRSCSAEGTEDGNTTAVRRFSHRPTMPRYGGSTEETRRSRRPRPRVAGCESQGTTGTTASSQALAEGHWYAHVCAVDEVGRRGEVATPDYDPGADRGRHPVCRPGAGKEYPSDRRTRTMPE